MNENERQPQNNTLLKVKLDVIFKKLFSENIDLLHDLLAGLLKLSRDSILL